MATDQDRLNDLITAAWAAVEARRDMLDGSRVPAPVRVPQPEAVQESRARDDFPVLQHLDATLTAARQHELADLTDQFAAALDLIPWTQNASYNETNCDPAFLAGYAYATIAGPDAPVQCASPRTGFFLMGPHLTYPAHNHAPEEAYLLLTPGIEWQLDGGEWFSVDAGQLIHHKPWQWHAMRTTDQPILAFAGWPEPGERLSIKFQSPAA